MKIVELIPQLEQGGAERFVIDLCNTLAIKHKVSLIILSEHTGYFEKEVNNTVTIIHLKRKNGYDMSLLGKIHKLFKKLKPDIVHTHLDTITYTILETFMFPSKIKFIHTVHNDAGKEAGERLSRWCRKFAFRTKKVVPVTISEESQRSFIDFYGITPPMIYNGRPAYAVTSKLAEAQNNLNKLKTNINSAMIANIARISTQKNQLPLAKAIVNLNKKGKNVELAIIGREDDVITPEILKLNCTQLHLIGTRSNPRDYMKASDAFCLSSVYEGMPITLIECFSVGAIPICTPVGGIVNMIEDGKNGILATGTSQEEIEAAILRFLNLTDEEKAEMKRNSSASFAKYDMETCANNYENLMQNKF